MTSELIQVFGRIGLLSFGGPAAQIALMHKELVETRNWLTEAQFLRALSFCMLLPGPEAMQLATYAGWQRAGILGGVIGGGLFVLPGAIVMTLLALAYGQFGNLPIAQALFLGVKATVVVIVIEAMIKISKRALKTQGHRFIALVAFVALFAFALPFPLVIAVAALIGAATSTAGKANQSHTPWPLRATCLTLLIGLALWVAPIALIVSSPFLLDIAQFFSTLAVVTFGGAYAVLAYMTQEVVIAHGWLSTPQMMDALGLAETTPGPLILITQFVAMIAGMAQGGVAMALAAGVLTLWVTFIPCFIWIFAGAPLIERLDGQPRLTDALSAITAAVVGVIANLSLWFAMHLFFAEVPTFAFGPFYLHWPALTSIQPAAIGLALIAGVMLLWRRWPLPLVLLMTALLSLILTFRQ
ncbi:chromate efflux transporter [Yoonia sp. BS5-3]|uniref:Chromate efflux transporter n=1 Tax=Yoonia phaeophyticola TaxID=3137369 RepID=A0ABZ2V1T2_9RHOB